MHTCINLYNSLQACAVMALERVPADIRRDGGVARMSDPQVQNVFCLFGFFFLFPLNNASLSLSLSV